MKCLTLVLGLVMGANFKSAVASDVDCSPSIDLVFLLDESGSLSSSDFEQMKDFITDIAEGLDFTNVQATAASFYHETIIQDGHENFSTSESNFLTVVNELYYINSDKIEGIDNNIDKDTEIGDALIETKENIFEVAINARPEAQKVIVVLTDGKTYCENRRWENGALNLGNCTSVADGVLALNPTVEENYVIFAVAIGNSVNDTEINTLTSNNDDRKFEVGDFGDLSDYIESLEAEICAIPVNCYATENIQYGECIIKYGCDGPYSTGQRAKNVTYTIINEAENGGDSCPVDYVGKEDCVYLCPIDCFAISTTTNGDCSCATGQRTVNTTWEIIEAAQNGGRECDHEDSSEDVDCDYDELDELCPAVDCVEIEETRQGACECENGTGTSILYTEYTITTEAKYGGKECTSEDDEEDADCSETCPQPVDCYATENIQYGECIIKYGCDGPYSTGQRAKNVTYTIINEAENGGDSCPVDYVGKEDCVYLCPIDCFAISTTTNGDCSCATGQRTVNTTWEIIEAAQNGGKECDHENSSEYVDCDYDELDELCPAIDCVEVEETRQDKCKCENGKGTSILYTEYTITTEASYGGRDCTGEDDEVEIDCSETCSQPVDCIEQEYTRQDECVCENGVGTYNFFTEYTVTPAENGGLDNCDTEGKVEVRDCSETCPQPVDCSEEESTRQDECVCENGVGTYNFFTEYTVTPAVNGGLDNCDTEDEVEVRDCSETCPQSIDCVEVESTRQDICVCDNGVGTYNFFTEYTVTPAENGGLNNCDTEDQVEVRDCSETCPQPVDCSEEESTRQDECVCENGVGTYNFFTEYIVTPAVNGGLDNCDTEDQVEVRDCSETCPQPVDCVEVVSTRQNECVCDKLTGKGTFKLYTDYTITPAINGGLNNCNTPNKEEEKDCSPECVKCQFQEFFTACDAICEEGVEGNVTGTNTTFFRDLEGNDASCVTVKPANKTDSCHVTCTATIIEDDDDADGPNTAVIAGAAAAGVALLAAGAVVTYFATKGSAVTPGSADAMFSDPNNTQVFNPLHQETTTYTANPLLA